MISDFPRRIAVLGSSGSIGKNALEVINGANGLLVPVLLSVHRRTDILADQIRQIADRSAPLPRLIIITDPAADRRPLQTLPKTIEIRFGHDALCKAIRQPDIDIVLSAIVGSAGLDSTVAALEAGKTVALANKESLVMGGSVLTGFAEKHGGRLIPVDSEHSAVMQALRSWKMNGKMDGQMNGKTDGGEETNGKCHSAGGAVEKIILTASGGPFRNRTLAELADVTVEDALAHPTWNMGKKITVDSATLINKALEIIEARWFFDIPAAKIRVMIHPQSLIHSMVEFIDGSVIAQMSPPDMRLPIQLALNYPYRFPGVSLKPDWTKLQTLEFYPPDEERFPAIPLGLEVAEKGGTAGTVINAANETAAAAFLAGKLSFQKIVPICRAVLEHHTFDPSPLLEQLPSVDRWARAEAEKMI